MKARDAIEVAYNNGKRDGIKEFAERAKATIEQMVDIMFDDDNISKCQIETCRYPSNIPCGNAICLEENKAFWKSKIDQIAKEMGCVE